MLWRALSRFPARLPHTFLPPQPHIVLPLRTYATPGRPKTVVGEPSRPVKRVVKKAARTPSDGSSAAEKKVASKRRSAVRKPKTPEQKAREAQRQEQQKERIANQWAASKVRADKLKASKKARVEKEKLADLKKAALEPPRHKVYSSAYNLFIQERTKGHTLSKDGGPGEHATLASFSRANGAAWKNASPADLEHYNHLCRTANEKQQAEYKRWLDSLSATEIQMANHARATLRRKLPSQKSKWAKIVDERAPKRPTNAYALFATNRQNSGDFKGIKLGERSKLIAQEWKILSESEKEKYQQLQKDDYARYREEYSSTYGRPPPTPAAAKKATAPAEANKEA